MKQSIVIAAATFGLLVACASPAQEIASPGASTPTHNASAQSTAPKSHLQDFLSSGNGNPMTLTPPVTAVHSYSSPGRGGAVLRGANGTARVGSDTIELKNGAVYVNGVSYGVVTPAQTVVYTVTEDKHTLQVDGQDRLPLR